MNLVPTLPSSSAECHFCPFYKLLTWPVALLEPQAGSVSQEPSPCHLCMCVPPTLPALSLQGTFTTRASASSSLASGGQNSQLVTVIHLLGAWVGSSAPGFWAFLSLSVTPEVSSLAEWFQPLQIQWLLPCPLRKQGTT